MVTPSPNEHTPPSNISQDIFDDEGFTVTVAYETDKDGRVDYSIVIDHNPPDIPVLRMTFAAWESPILRELLAKAEARVEHIQSLLAAGWRPPE